MAKVPWLAARCPCGYRPARLLRAALWAQEEGPRRVGAAAQRRRRRPDATSFTAFGPAGAAPCAARESLDRYLEKCGGRAPPPPPAAPSLLPLYGYSLGLAAALAVLVRRIGVERFGTISADLANRYAALLHAAAHAPRAGGGGGAAAVAAASGANPNAIATAAALPPPLPPAAAVQVVALHLFALHEVSQLPPAHAAASATAAAALPPPPSPSLLVPPAPLPPLLPLALALALRWLGDTLHALPRSMVRRALARSSPRGHPAALEGVRPGLAPGPGRSALAARWPTKKAPSVPGCLPKVADSRRLSPLQAALATAAAGGRAAMPLVCTPAVDPRAPRMRGRGAEHARRTRRTRQHPASGW